MRDFLLAIWGEEDAGLFGEVRLIKHIDGDPKIRQAWAHIPRDVDDLIEVAMREDGFGVDVYFGVLPRTQRIGRNDTIVDETRVLWADFDGKAYAESKLGAFHAMASLAPAPQIVVDSGNGYHGYWLLREEVDFENARQVMRGIAIASNGDLKVADKARILRIPGTRNHKAEPIPVRLLRFDITGRRHRFSDFVDFAETAARADRPVRQHRKRAESVSGNWEPSEEDAPKFPDGERNNGLTRLAGIMVARGLDPDELLTALMHENEMRCDPPLPEREVEHIARSVERYR